MRCFVPKYYISGRCRDYAAEDEFYGPSIADLPDGKCELQFYDINARGNGLVTVVYTFASRADLYAYMLSTSGECQNTVKEEVKDEAEQQQ